MEVESCTTMFRSMTKNNFKRIVNKSNRIITDLKSVAGFNKPYYSEGKRIIMYHGIDSRGCKEFNLRHVGVGDFEKQIKYFKKYYHIISLENYFNEDFNKNQITIAITFDDGYANNFKYALPVLLKYKVPATFFITGLNHAGYNILWPDFIEIAATLIDKNIKIEDELFVKRENKWFRCSDQKSLHQIIKERGCFEYKLKAIEAIKKSYLILKRTTDMMITGN